MTEEQIALETRKVKALEKIANSVDALTIWFEEVDKQEWSERIQYYLSEFHKFNEPKDDKTLNENFEPLKSSVISKLTSLKRDNNDYETGKRINETISKIKNDKIDLVSLIKLKTLNESL